MTRFVFAAILIVTTTLIGGNVAAAASNPTLPQNQTEAASITLPDSDFTQFRHTNDRSFATPPVPLYLADSNVCQTPVGSCGVPFALSGTSCWCNFYGRVYWGYVL